MNPITIAQAIQDFENAQTAQANALGTAATAKASVDAAQQKLDTANSTFSDAKSMLDSTNSVLAAACDNVVAAVSSYRSTLGVAAAPPSVPTGPAGISGPDGNFVAEV